MDARGKHSPRNLFLFGRWRRLLWKVDGKGSQIGSSEVNLLEGQEQTDRSVCSFGHGRRKEEDHRRVRRSFEKDGQK